MFKEIVKINETQTPETSTSNTFRQRSLDFSVAQQPKSGNALLIVKVNKSHTIRNIYTLGLLSIGDQHVEKPATYTKDNYEKRTSISSAGFFLCSLVIIRTSSVLVSLS